MTASRSIPSWPSISAAAAGPDTCLRAGTIFMLRRGSRRMDDGSHGLPGIIPTCRGTARSSTSARSLNNGGISQVEPIAGGATESIFQPEWSPDGAQIVLVSDRSGWWNLYSLDLATRAMRALAPMAAEFGLPQWLLGMSTYAFAGPERIVCTYSQGGLGCLAVLDLANERLTPVATPFTEFGSMRAVGDRAVFRAGAPDHPASIVALDLGSGRHSVLKRATDILDRPDLHVGDYLTRVETVEFPTTGGETAFGLFYPPRNPDYAPGAEERPPLLVKCHGGPTSAASSTLNLGVQYWTSRGIAVLDVNYRGSTGFGRAYRDRLQLNWGRGRRRRLRRRRAVPRRARAG